LTVEFFVDDVSQGAPKTLNSTTGQASITVTDLDVGIHDVHVVYRSNSYFSDHTSATIPQTVLEPDTTTTVTASVPSSVFSQPVVFTANVALDNSTTAPTGVVKFFVDGVERGQKTLSGGQATLSLSDLAVNDVAVPEHSVVVKYIPTNPVNFHPSDSAPLAHTVGQADTKTTLVSSAPTALLNNPLTFTATVAGVSPALGKPTTGKVIFYIDDVEQTRVDLNSLGKAAYTPSSPLPVGEYTVEAVFEGNTNFATSTSEEITQVVGRATEITITSTSKPKKAVLGAAVTFTAKVKPQNGSGTPRGQVIFTVDGVEQPAVDLDGNGKAKVTLTNATVGNHTVLARYEPDAVNSGGFLPQTQTASKFVNKGKVKLKFVGVPRSVEVGTAVPFNVEALPLFPSEAFTPTGSVQFLIDGQVRQTVELDSGAAFLPPITLPQGPHTITAIYQGSDNFSPTTATFQIKIKPEGRRQGQ
jgi:hypothetical protein